MITRVQTELGYFSGYDILWLTYLLEDVAVGKKILAYCQTCRRDTHHKRGRRGRYHCLVCGAENPNLKQGGKAQTALPPGFVLEKQVNGQLGLYVATATPKERDLQKKPMYYLKGTFPSVVKPREIQRRAWELYTALKKEAEHA